jgi:LysW-gamma-L-alpha-aminoadipyl-6-phosphate/LysW-L-glutamyl-5-phosphate reductase
MKRFKAAVIGGTGYGGAEMIRRLLIHPDVELTRVVAVDHVGESLGAVHPPLTGRSALVFENVPPAEAAKDCDIALLGLPHKVSATFACATPRPTPATTAPRTRTPRRWGRSSMACRS